MSRAPRAPWRGPRLGWLDPVAQLELRLQGRSWRHAVLVTGTVAAAGLTVWLTYVARSGSASLTEAPTALETASIGRAVFEWSTLCLAAVPVVLAPILAAPLVAVERERHTLLPLLLTRLSASSVVGGKALAGAVLTAVPVVAGAPVLALATAIGGVTIGQVLATTGILAAEASVLALLAAGAGSSARSTVAAIGRGALLVAAVALGPFVLAAALVIPDAVAGSDPVDPPAQVIALSPLASVADVAGAHGGAPDAGTPLGTLRGWVVQRGEPDRPWWAVGLGVDLVVAAAALVVAARSIRLPDARATAEEP